MPLLEHRCYAKQQQLATKKTLDEQITMTVAKSELEKDIAKMTAQVAKATVEKNVCEMSNQAVMSKQSLEHQAAADIQVSTMTEANKSKRELEEASCEAAADLAEDRAEASRRQLAHL